jgi:basic amino acid/polyamine antiporter, APA family
MRLDACGRRCYAEADLPEFPFLRGKRMSQPTSPSLLRVLGPWTVVAIVVGSVIGSGVFKKPQVIAQNVQGFEWIIAAWVLVGILSLLGALAVAELGAMLPQSGGSYVFLTKGYGRLWGFLWGWVEFWIMRSGAVAALAMMFSQSYFQSVGWSVGNEAKQGLAIGAILLLAVVNAIGVRYGGWVQNLTTWIKVGSLVTIALLPFWMGGAHPEYLQQSGPTPEHGPFGGFVVALLGIFWAYKGWMDLSTLGDEVREPQRNVPRALLWGVLIVITVYVAANVAYALVLPPTEMADKKKVEVVAISFAERLFQPWGSSAASLAAAAMAAAIMVSALGALNANTLFGPRTYYAMGRDGLFPRWFGHVPERTRTPVVAILAQAVWASLLILGAELLRDSPTEDPFDTLTNFVMFGAMIFETMAIAAIFRLRQIAPDMERPYRCWGYPWVPLVYVLVMLGVVVSVVYSQPIKSFSGLSFIAVGAGVYFLISRRASPGDTAPR